MTPFDLTSTQVFLLDIEGTTTPVDYVYRVLFPFAYERVEKFLEANGDREDVRTDVLLLRGERDGEQDMPPPWNECEEKDRRISAVKYFRWLMDRDRKSTGLKSLQGKIWQEGYAEGTLRGEVYPDVPRALERWKSSERKICIFSSGSVLAQKLLFRSTRHGDLTSYIDAYFDTTSGPKHEPQSYALIAGILRTAPARILFVPDVARELDAANEIGLSTALCPRPGTEAGATGIHPVLHTFDGL